MSQEKSKKKLADSKNPTIEAVLNELFKFKEEEQAQNRLELIKKNFVISKTQKEDAKAVRLWVRGYALTSGEKKKGYTGNFAIISYYKNDENKFVLRAEKDETDLKLHPDKERPKQTHPDWGHKILRTVKAKKTYKTEEAANEVLTQLFEEFPDITIPAVNRLYIMIYEKAEKGQSPIQKYIFEIRQNEAGEFSIVWSLNNERKKSQASPKAPEIEREIKGKFTTMVEVRRKKKARK